jgi:hypothetical protein
MNKSFHSTAILMLLSTLNPHFSIAHAQGTAFTYQGQLQNNGSPASGTYNLTFSIYTNGIGGTAVAGPVTNTAINITNGLFTVAVDFGAGVWNGATNWLQIGVASSGVGGFTPLAPRQALTPVPYAITADKLSGVLSANQLPNFQGPDYATIGGGSGNTATNVGATVGGGFDNSASGQDATVPGGQGNSAAGQSSFAAGQNARATDNNSFVWGDGTLPAFSQGADTFAVLATGGVYFYTTDGGVGAAFDDNGDLDFGVTTRQMINLYSDTYGIGVQNNDEYFRSADEFFWYVGGLHNDGNGNAGGGLQAMELDNDGNLFLTGAVTANSVFGSTAASASGGVSGVNLGSGPGIVGTGNSGDGIDGYSASGLGVSGTTTNGNAGVRGFAIVGDGVEGVSSNGIGVEGGTVNGPYGISGVNDGFGDGISGVAVVGDGVYAESEGSGAGVHGVNIGTGPAGKFDGNVSISGTVSFGSEIAQMLNLYSTTYAIGVQNSDEFFRTANSFFWYGGGAYASDFGDAGSGGTQLMQLGSTGNLVVKGTVTANGVLLTSDRQAKENFVSVDPQVVLAKVASLPVTEWNYKLDDQGVQHIGPMAQDFQAAFKLSTDDKHISVLDEGGVALAAIQGLNLKVDEKEARIQEQAAEIQDLKNSVAELKTLMQSLASRK